VTGQGVPSRSLERVTAFTDAAIAIALTLLVLPLVDLARGVSDSGVSAMLREHVSDFVAFLISFFVVASLWRVHRQIFESLDGVDETLLIFNSWWLLGVVFLPVPTAVLTFGSGSTNTTVLYLANLFFITLVGLVVSLWIYRHPQLQASGGAARSARHVRRGVVVCAFVAVTAVLAIPFASLSLLFLALLPLVQRLADRLRWP
jgi:uncharacterized membrane protein